MATDNRQELHNLKADIIKNARYYEFWQVLRLLDINGELAKIWQIPAQSLDFPSCDINRCSVGDEKRLVLELNFMGLYGKDSPLPQYFFESAQQNSVTGESLRAFLNIFNHKIYDLLYQAWKKYHPFLYAKTFTTYQKYLNSFAGFTSGSKKINEVNYPSLLGAFTHNCCGLAGMVSDYLEGAKVTIKPFAVTWTNLAVTSKIGCDHLRLGDLSFLGNEITSKTQKFLIQIGPVSHEKAFKVLPGQKEYQKLCELIRAYTGPNLFFELNLIVYTEQNYCTKLGANNFCLNWRSWLGVPQTDNYQIKLAA